MGAANGGCENEIVGNTQSYWATICPCTKCKRRRIGAWKRGLRSVAVFVGVSNSFNQKNINRQLMKVWKRLDPLFQLLKEEGIFIRACISTAFYCPYEGKIDPDAVAMTL